MFLPRFSILVGLSILLLSARSAWGQEDPTIRGRRVSEWFKFLRDDQDPRRRLAALNLIDTDAGPKVTIVFTNLVKELRENADPAIRARITVLLPRYRDGNDEVVTALKTALIKDKDGKVRESAAVSLGKLELKGIAAVPELGEALKDSHAGTRAAAAETIGRYSRLDPEVAKETLSGLETCLKDADARVRLNAAFAMGRMGAAASGAVRSLAAVLTGDKDTNVRKEVAKTLASIGPPAAEATPALLATLSDSNAELRQAALIALGKVEPNPATVMTDLLKATRDPDKSVRCHAIHAIGGLGKAAIPVIPQLIEILKKDDVADVRLAVIEELAGFGPDAKAAIDVLTIASRDGRPAIRDAAQEALKKIQKIP